MHLLDKQQGFRIGRGNTDGIYIAKRIHQITNQIKRSVYTLFIDIMVAFDHVPRETILRAMKNYYQILITDQSPGYFLFV